MIRAYLATHESKSGLSLGLDILLPCHSGTFSRKLGKILKNLWVKLFAIYAPENDVSIPSLVSRLKSVLEVWRLMARATYSNF